MSAVLRLDNRHRDIGTVVEDVVGSLLLAPGRERTSDVNLTVGERDLFSHLRSNIPASLPNTRRYELGADIPFTQRLLVHGPPFPKVAVCPYAQPHVCDMITPKPRMFQHGCLEWGRTLPWPFSNNDQKVGCVRWDTGFEGYD